MENGALEIACLSRLLCEWTGRSDARPGPAYNTIMGWLSAVSVRGRLCHRQAAYRFKTL